MQAFYYFFLSVCLYQQANNPPFKIAITADSPTVVAESDISIRVSLTNTSEHEVNEGVMYKDGVNLDSTFRFEVRDEHGKLVPRRTYPQRRVADR